VESIIHNFVSRVIERGQRRSIERTCPPMVLFSQTISYSGHGGLIQFRSNCQGFLEQNYGARS